MVRRIGDAGVWQRYDTLSVGYGGRVDARLIVYEAATAVAQGLIGSSKQVVPTIVECMATHQGNAPVQTAAAALVAQLALSVCSHPQAHTIVASLHVALERHADVAALRASATGALAVLESAWEWCAQHLCTTIHPDVCVWFATSPRACLLLCVRVTIRSWHGCDPVTSPQVTQAPPTPQGSYIRLIVIAGSARS